MSIRRCFDSFRLHGWGRTATAVLTMFLLHGCTGYVSDPAGLGDNEDERGAFGSGLETTCQGEVAVKVKAVLHTSVDERQYRAFVDEISKFFSDSGVRLKLVISSLTRSSTLPNRWDTQLSAGVDFTMLVGPDWGGYLGPPYFNIGANTNSPFGWSRTGIVAEAHEIMHHFGVPDYYTIAEDARGADTSLDQDPMVSVYNTNRRLHPNTRRILCFNLNRSSAQGRSAIYYPTPDPNFAAGTPTRFGYQVTMSLRIPAAQQTCKVYRMTYDWTSWTPGYAPSPSATVTLSALKEGSFSVSDIREWYNGFKIDCGGKQPFFAPSPALEDCFFAAQTPAAVRTCRLTCETPGKWCSGNPAEVCLPGAGCSSPGKKKDWSTCATDGECVSSWCGCNGGSAKVCLPSSAYPKFCK